MIKRFVQAACLVAGFALASVAANAGTVSRLIGDQDGFDSGSVLGNGDMLDRFSIPIYGELDSELTDRIIPGDVSLGADFVYSGAITSAQIEIFAGGWGLYGAASLYVNGIQVGLLTITEDVDNFTESVFKDVFDLTPLLAQLNLTGHDTIEVRAAMGLGPELDAGAIDYALITINTTDASPGLPEPATPALAALALAAAALARRRR